MGELVEFPDDAARYRLRPRPQRPVSAYALAEMRFKASFELMTRFCLAFLEGRQRSSSFPVHLAVSAVSGFFAQTPSFTQAWVEDGRDHNLVQFLVRANAHAAHLRTALECLRTEGPLLQSPAKEIRRHLEIIAVHVEGVLETTFTALPARL